jgi:hypothetical protein
MGMIPNENLPFRTLHNSLLIDGVVGTAGGDLWGLWEKKSSIIQLDDAILLLIMESRVKIGWSGYNTYTHN